MRPFLKRLGLAVMLVLCSYGSTHAEPKTRAYLPIVNIKATAPQSASLELGMAYQVRDQSSGAGIGPFISYEPGINGQKAHLGIAYAHVTDPADAIVVKFSASYYQAWRDSSGVNSGDHTYGAEITGAFGFFLVSGGLYHNNGEYTGTIGVGIGW